MPPYHTPNLRTGIPGCTEHTQGQTASMRPECTPSGEAIDLEVVERIPWWARRVGPPVKSASPPLAPRDRGRAWRAATFIILEMEILETTPITSDPN